MLKKVTKEGKALSEDLMKIVYGGTCSASECLDDCYNDPVVSGKLKANEGNKAVI